MFTLARDLGMTVGRLTEEMDSVEFFYWRELYELETDEAGRAERGEPPRRTPSRPAAARRKLISDPGEIRRWFSQHGGR